MALDQFWTSVRTGLRLYAPPRVIADSPRLDSEAIQKALARADLWLTPATVRGYDRADFDFLPAEYRDELARLVEGFQKVVAGVNPRGPATEEQVRLATPLFRGIVEALEFDRFADADAFRVGKVLESDPVFPKDGVDARYRTGPDFNGEPGLKIMMYLPDSDLESFLARAATIRRDVTESVLRHGQPYWPYMSFRFQSDLAELQNPGADE